MDDVEFYAYKCLDYLKHTVRSGVSNTSVNINATKHYVKSFYKTD